MQPDQKILRIPGPSPIPPSVERAMTKPMIGHRDSETKELLQKIRPKLQSIFGAKEEVIILSGSGTAGLETAVVNATEPNDEVLVVVTGAFGERFFKLCETYQLQTHRLDVPWGQAAEPKEIVAFLKSHPNIKAVFFTYCETSTGVLNPIQALTEAVRQHSNALVIVDGVSCAGAVETKMDEWGIDIFVTGSQKAFMLPPGLAFIGMSGRAKQAMIHNKHPRFYFDLTKYEDQLKQNSTPFTPAISLLFGLEQVLHLMEEEGLESIYERHDLMMRMTRAAFRALDIPLLAADHDASPTVTAVQPADFSAEALRKELKQRFGLAIAGGQQHLKGKIFRVGHMGYCSPADVLQYISIMEVALVSIGKNIELGKGTKAAQEILAKQE